MALVAILHVGRRVWIVFVVGRWTRSAVTSCEGGRESGTCDHCDDHSWFAARRLRRCAIAMRTSRVLLGHESVAGSACNEFAHGHSFHRRGSMSDAMLQSA